MATTYPVPLAGQRITASLLTSMLPLFVVKAADETVNNSATFQSDNELVLAVVANATYLLDMHVLYQSGTTPDLSIAFSVPAGTTMAWSPHGLDQLVSGNAGNVFLTKLSEAQGAGLGGAGTTTPVAARICGLVQVSSTAGNLQFRWAQLTINASNTTVFAGSWMKLTRVA